MSAKIFTPNVCEHCHQTTDYALALDRGTAMIVIAFVNAVRRHGRNRVHIHGEMIAQNEGGRSHIEMIHAGYMTPIMEHNVVRPRYHGLIAFVDKGSGEYLLTRKGADFLRGHPVQRVAIIDKVAGRNSGYLESAGTVTIGELLRKDADMWAGNMSDIRASLEVPEFTEPLLI